MKKAPAKSAGSPKKQRTKSKVMSGIAPQLMVTSGYLIVKGEDKLRIDEDGFVNMPRPIMDGIHVENIPEDVSIRLVLDRDHIYPMWQFQAIEVTRYEKERLDVSMHAESHREIWTDPLSVATWQTIMEAACKLEFEGGLKIPEITGRNDEGDLFINVSIHVVGETIDEVMDDALGHILAIEQRARAFHFVVAEEKDVY